MDKLALLYLNAAFSLKQEGLSGIETGDPVILYHGTTKTFKRFDLNRSREDFVKDYYGKGIFLTPSKKVAWQYAQAPRNTGFDVSIIKDIKKINPNIGWGIELIYKHGFEKGWEVIQEVLEEKMETYPTYEIIDKYFGLNDTEILTEIAEHIIGSNVKPTGDYKYGAFGGMFGGGDGGTPEYLFKVLEELGLNADKYRPKVYTVVVRVSNPLVTRSQALARKAQSKGYDSVVYYGPQLVGGVPEVAIFDSRDIKIKKVET